MEAEYKRIVSETKQDDNTKKWCYTINRNNSYNTTILYETAFKYPSEEEALKAINTDGKFDKYNDQLS